MASSNTEKSVTIEETVPARSDLVTTKLFPPVSGGHLIERRRLLDEFALPALKRLTLVTAPAGFGKTTLLAHGYRVLAGNGINAAWVSLDAEDAEPAHFLAYVIASLEDIGMPGDERLKALLDSASNLNLSGVLRRLAALLARFEQPVVLFLDDYHRADGECMGDVVEALLASAPANLHLVIASRSVPQLPLARLRVSDSVTDLDADALKFDATEACAFLRDARGLTLPQEDVELLQRRTEGWIAGLQLAALALKTRQHSAQLIASFTGDARDVADYLASEVLDRLPAGWRNFLLRTCMLERMNAALCNELIGGTDAQQKLEALENGNLFVVPLDHNRTWYRYHHMFGVFLRGRAQRDDPTGFVSLCARAADWLEREGLLGEALESYLLGGHEEAAAKMVEAHTLYLTGLGRMPDLIRWIGRLPRPVLARRPRLSMSLGWALFHTRRHTEAAAAVARAEAIVEALDATGQLTDEAERQSILADLEVLKAGIAVAADDHDSSFRITERLLQQYPGRANFQLATVSNIHGYSCYARSDFDTARASLQWARRIHESIGGVFGVAYADIFLGQLEAAQGRLHQANASYKRALDTASSASGVPPNLKATASVMRASVLYQWNRMDEAAGLLDENLELVVDYGHPDGPFTGMVIRARIAMAQGNPAGAQSWLSQARSLGRDGGPDRLVLMSNLEYLRYFLVQGRMEDALRLAHEHGVSLCEGNRELDVGAAWDRCGFLRAVMRLRLLLAVGRHDDALTLAADIAALTRRVGRRARLLQMHVLSARIHETAERRAEALEHLEQALAMAHAQGFVRTFVDEGPAIARLLRAFVEKNGANGREAELTVYARRLSRAFRPEKPPAKVRADLPGARPLRDPLSERERDILRLLAVGRPNRAIAQELSISENTVKWHLKNVYEKLGVENRTVAVLAAQNLDLID